MTEPMIDVDFTAAESAEILEALRTQYGDDLIGRVVAKLGEIEQAERRLMRSAEGLQAKARYRERADALMGAARIIAAMAP